jgi:hypothetical protein
MTYAASGGSSATIEVLEQHAARLGLHHIRVDGQIAEQALLLVTNGRGTTSRGGVQ